MLYAAVGDLGLSPDQFYDTTPRHLLGMLKYVYKREEHREILADARLSHLTLWVTNYLRDKEKRSKPFEPGDFFPLLRGPDWVEFRVPTIEELMEGRRIMEERIRRIDLGLPVEDVQVHPQTVKMIKTVTDFMETNQVGKVVTSGEPITRRNGG